MYTITGYHRGFTIVELLVVLVIIGFLLAFSVAGIMRYAAYQSLSAEATEVYGFVRETREQTLADADTVFGIHIATSSITRFRGPVYDPATSTNVTLTLDTVTLASSLATTSSTLHFQRLTGAPSATGTIAVQHVETGDTQEIVIHASGMVTN